METRKTLFDPEIVKNPWKKEADGSAGRLKAHNPQYTQMMLQQWGRGLPKQIVEMLGARRTRGNWQGNS